MFRVIIAGGRDYNTMRSWKEQWIALYLTLPMKLYRMRYGKRRRYFVDALELSEAKEQVKSLTVENTALKAYKAYFADMYGEGYEVANYHLNGDLEPFDNFLDGAEAEYNALIEKEEFNE